MPTPVAGQKAPFHPSARMLAALGSDVVAAGDQEHPGRILHRPSRNQQAPPVRLGGGERYVGVRQASHVCAGPLQNGTAVRNHSRTTRGAEASASLASWPGIVVAGSADHVEEVVHVPAVLLQQACAPATVARGPSSPVPLMATTAAPRRAPEDTHAIQRLRQQEV